MTKITTDFAGTETLAETKTRLGAILDAWGYDPSAYSSWGDARTDLNDVLQGTSQGVIADGERASVFRPKINFLNDPVAVNADLFSDSRPGHTAAPLPGYVFSDTAGTTPATLGGTVARVNSPVSGQPHLLMADAPDRLIWGRMPAVGVRNLYNQTSLNPNNLWTKGMTAIEIVEDEFSTVKLVEGSTGGDSTYRLEQTVNVVAGQQYTASYLVKPAGRDWVTIRLEGDPAPVSSMAVDFNLTDRTREAVDAAFDDATIGPSGSGSVITATFTAAATGVLIARLHINAGQVGFSGGQLYTGDGVSGLLVKEPQFEKGAARTPYQRVTSAFDVTQSGQRSIYYLQGNGVNQYMATSANVDMSSVSAAAMVAGLEVLDKSVGSWLVSHPGLGAGALNITSDASPSERWRSILYNDSEVSTQRATPSDYPAPDRAVITAEVETTDLVLRRNAAELSRGAYTGPLTGLADAPLAVLARNTGAAPANARWFGHTFCNMTAAELARTEAYHAYLTGETLA